MLELTFLIVSIINPIKGLSWVAPNDDLIDASYRNLIRSASHICLCRGRKNDGGWVKMAAWSLDSYWDRQCNNLQRRRYDFRCPFHLEHRFEALYLIYKRETNKKSWRHPFSNKSIEEIWHLSSLEATSTSKCISM